MTEVQHLIAHVQEARAQYPLIASRSPYLKSVSAILACQETVSRTGRPVYMLQVGAMDGKTFDPMYGYVTEFGWHGLLVEPLPDMVERLRVTYAGHAGLVFEQAAITEQVETRSIYRIPVEVAQRENLPVPVIGWSSFTMHELNEFSQHVVEEQVRCLPLRDVLTRHNPAAIDVVQIDTEGYDWTVLRQFPFGRYRPYYINYEDVHLSADDRADARALLRIHGYAVHQRTQFDVFAYRPELFN